MDFTIHFLPSGMKSHAMAHKNMTGGAFRRYYQGSQTHITRIKEKPLIDDGDDPLGNRKWGPLPCND